jgi:hypothetical protein
MLLSEFRKKPNGKSFAFSKLFLSLTVNPACGGTGRRPSGPPLAAGYFIRDRIILQNQ